MSYKIKFKNDSYKKSRGGYSRLLDISCTHCGGHLFYYQKDGPGLLKRMYLDRIYKSDKYFDLNKRPLSAHPPLVCTGCKELLGVPYIYKRENRPAYRLFVGTISKKIVSSKKVK